MWKTGGSKEPRSEFGMYLTEREMPGQQTCAKAAILTGKTSSKK